MTISVHVHFTPASIEPEKLKDCTAVVIDVLRASTTIVHALAHGAQSVIPVLEIAQALHLASQSDRRSVLLGGERYGKLITGFDLDNSPLNYTPEIVRGKTVIFTTTNGTRALAKCASADIILIGAIVNLHAVALAALKTGRPLHLVCAGTEGEISAEDVLTAGAIASEIQQLSPSALQWNDSAMIARDYFIQRSATNDSLYAAFCESRGGRNLLELGYECDIERSVTRDLFEVVPVFHPESGTLTLT
ncbi:MAG: 2-phosphosulfolactate phosphatase [Planctomycetaceae bacterium]